MIDCLWRDRGDWHVLLYDTTPKVRRRRNAGIPQGAALAAVAVRSQFGGWPASVRLWRLAAGRGESWGPEELAGTLWAAV